MPSLDELLTEVDNWFAEEIQHVPLNQSTELYNQIHAAWQSLRNRLSVAITGQPLKAPEPKTQEEPSAGVEAATETEAGAAGAEQPELLPDASKASKPPKAG